MASTVDLWLNKDKSKKPAYGKGKRWEARWRDPAGQSKSKCFETKGESDRYGRQMEDAKDQGTYTDPKAGQTLLSTYAEQWLQNMTNSHGTNVQTASRVRNHIIDPIGHLPLTALLPSTIQAWVKGREKVIGPTTIHLVHGHLVTILNAAVDDIKIPRNNALASSVRLPRVPKTKLVPWTSEQVGGMYQALPDRYSIMVQLGAMCGLRQGEIFGLRVHDVDFLRAIVHVRRQVLTPDGHQYFGLPKGGKERDVPLPPELAPVLAAYLAAYPPVEVTLPWEKPGGKPTTETLIITSREAKAMNKRYVNQYLWKPALVELGIESEGTEGRKNMMHALRHFFASWVLEGGTGILQLAEWLGHADTGFTMRTYTHLMPDSADRAKDSSSRIYGQIMGVPAASADRSTGTAGNSRGAGVGLAPQKP